jgi:hypothetical protein
MRTDLEAGALLAKITNSFDVGFWNFSFEIQRVLWFKMIMSIFEC